ncbi:hypothetical protein C8R45DRAFT_1097024 [Mycena sanguinolenta]|nr:hypothetical protein C8R45DRAFT_1097024 [Mycena sanguinolenta]
MTQLLGCPCPPLLPFASSAPLECTPIALPLSVACVDLTASTHAAYPPPPLLGSPPPNLSVLASAGIDSRALESAHAVLAHLVADHWEVMRITLVFLRHAELVRPCRSFRFIMEINCWLVLRSADV